MSQNKNGYDRERILQKSSLFLPSFDKKFQSRFHFQSGNSEKNNTNKKGMN